MSETRLKNARATLPEGYQFGDCGDPFERMTTEEKIEHCRTHYVEPARRAIYQEYLNSDFRREWMKYWAGDDPEKQRIVADMLAQTTPM